MAFVLADMTAFVMRLLLFLYIPPVIWTYSALPVSVTSVPWFLFSYLFIFLSPSLFLTVLYSICLWVSFSMSSSPFCLGFFEPLDFSVVFCLPFPGYQVLDGVTKGIPVGPGDAPLRPCKPGSGQEQRRSAVPEPGAVAPSAGMPSGGRGAGRVHLCVDVWRCANGGAWSACS